jgi:hypothetical protein
LVFFFLFAFLVNGALMAPFLVAGREARVACGLGAAGVWIAALYDAVRVAARAARAGAPQPAAPPAAEKKEGEPVA